MSNVDRARVEHLVDACALHEDWLGDAGALEAWAQPYMHEWPQAHAYVWLYQHGHAQLREQRLYSYLNIYGACA